MSHNIQSNDIVTSVEACWHGLERRVPVITFPLSGLDWQVSEGVPVVNGVTFASHKGLYRADIGLPLHVFKDSYHVIQNSALWEAMDKALSGIPYEVATAGSLGDCRRTFVSIKLKGEKSSFVRGDEFKDYLTFINSFDGSSQVRLYGSNTRVVCQNTLNLSLSDKGFIDLKIKHTSGAQIAFERMSETVQSALQSKAHAYADLSKLAEQGMSAATAENVLAGFVFDGKAGPGKAYNQGSEMLRLFSQGKGNVGETRYDLLNAVTEYQTHQTNSKNVGKRLESNMLGTAATRKQDMLETLLSDEALDAMATKGAAMLDEAGLTLINT